MKKTKKNNASPDVKKTIDEVHRCLYDYFAKQNNLANKQNCFIYRFLTHKNKCLNNNSCFNYSKFLLENIPVDFKDNVDYQSLDLFISFVFSLKKHYENKMLEYDKSKNRSFIEEFNSNDFFDYVLKNTRMNCLKIILWR